MRHTGESTMKTYEEGPHKEREKSVYAKESVCTERERQREYKREKNKVERESERKNESDSERTRA